MVQRVSASTGFTRGDRLPHLGGSERRIGTPYAMPAKCQVWLRVTESGSGSGPQVSMLASLLLSSIQVQLLHRPSAAATDAPTEQLAIALPLVPAQERVSRPSRTFRGPVHGSWMTLQLYDHERSPLTEEHDVGVCVDGIREVLLPLAARVYAAAWLSIRDARDRPEQLLRLDGELVFLSGISVRLRLRPVGGTGDAIGTNVDVPLASVGTTLHLSERMVERDLPGLPAMLLAFIDAEGRQIGRERVAYVHPR